MTSNITKKILATTTMIIWMLSAPIFGTDSSDNIDDSCYDDEITIVDKSASDTINSNDRDSDSQCDGLCNNVDGNPSIDHRAYHEEQYTTKKNVKDILQSDNFIATCINIIYNSASHQFIPPICRIIINTIDQDIQYINGPKFKKYSRNVEYSCKGDVMAIYIANNLPDNIQDTINRANKIGSNAIIVNIKDDFGRITFDSSEASNKKLICRSIIQNIKHKIAELKKNGLYTIARIVTYKDPFLLVKPEYYNLYILNKQIDQNTMPQKTDIWCDKEKIYWLNPFNPQVTQYLLSIVREACLLGFDEIHLDYVRFSSYLNETVETYNNPNHKTRSQAVNEFVQHAKDVAHSYGKKLSIAIFGIVPVEAYMHLTEVILRNENLPSVGDNDEYKYTATMRAIGQDYNSLCKIADYVCPMLYPSHFPYGYFGIQAPDKEPYRIIATATQMACFVNKYHNHTAEIRPYLQCFTASWLKKDAYIKYNGHTLNQQIKACCDNDIYSFYLFNNTGYYKDFDMDTK